jgi:succinate dehydrogenase / fumarate reductase, cytochrome b subunit
MTGALTLYSTTIGKKVIMAVSGLIWVGFVLVHLFGNLKVYTGAEHFNEYAEGLRTFGAPILPYGGFLWIARVVLIAAIVLHVVMAAQLTQRSIAGRSVGYRAKKSVQATLASKTMRYGGVAVLLFLAFHILHLTTGTVHSNFIYGDAYHNFVAGFQNPLVSLIYIVAMVALALHLYHGTWSMFQTLGLNNRRYNQLWRGLALAIAAVVFVGNVSFPLAVLAGIIV